MKLREIFTDKYYSKLKYVGDSLKDVRIRLREKRKKRKK